MFMTILTIIILVKAEAAHGGGFDFSTFNRKGQSFTKLAGQ